MLPGFRFLSVAIVLGVSMLIFGLGAAALLRATHKEFASLPLKQMPEVTFGSRPETEEPTLAVLQVDTPGADPAEPGPDQAAAQHPPMAMTGPQPQPEFTTAAIPAPDATSNATPAPSPAPSDSISTTAADMTASADANTAKLSERPPSVVASAETADDIAKTTAIKSDVIKSDVSNSNVGVSDVAETMASPFGNNFKPLLPVSRPAQAAQLANLTPSAAKQPSTKPPPVAKRTRHRKAVRRLRRLRPFAPKPARLSASPFASD